MSTTFQDGLGEPRRRVVRLMQDVHFGTIEGLAVRGGQPVLDPEPSVVREYKFAADNDAHPSSRSPDFRLKAQLVDFFRQLDAIGDGVIRELEVRHGLPFRMYVRGGPPRRGR
jgi:hypothetical protein